MCSYFFSTVYIISKPHTFLPEYKQIKQSINVSQTSKNKENEKEKVDIKKYKWTEFCYLVQIY